jgi:hypothetical protein
MQRQANAVASGTDRNAFRGTNLKSHRFANIVATAK